MFKMTHTILSTAISVASLMLTTGSYAADAPKAQLTDMNAFTCKDVVRATGDERSIALAILHGYYLGKAGATKYDSSKLGKASDDFIEYCLDNPKDQALSAFGKFVK